MDEILKTLIVGGLIVGTLAFFFGEPIVIRGLLGYLTYVWIGNQPDKLLAIVQAGLAWVITLELNQIFILSIRLYKVLKYKRQFADYQAAQALFKRAGLNWDYEMNRARQRLEAREKMYWNVGLSNRHDREVYFSIKDDYGDD